MPYYEKLYVQLKINILNIIQEKFNLFRDKNSNLKLEEKLNLTFERMYSSYESALKKNKIIDFYLGRNDYSHLNYEYGLHDTSISFNSLIDYSKQNGNQKMLHHFKNDIEKILKLDLTCKEFLYIIKYIYLYLHYNIEEKKLDIDWNVENKIKILIQKKVSNLSKIYPLDIKYNNLDDATYLKQILLELEIIKKRFDVDLLDVK